MTALQGCDALIIVSMKASIFDALYDTSNAKNIYITVMVTYLENKCIINLATKCAPAPAT